MTEEPHQSEKSPEREAGCMERLVALSVVLLISGLAYALFLIFSPQHMKDIAASDQPARDLKTVFQKSIEGSYELTISEEEINAYIAQTLAMQQKGFCEKFASLEKVLVRLEKDRAEVTMVRKVAGLDLTISMWCKVSQTENERGEIQTHVDFDGGPLSFAPGIARGGRFGKLVVPQGFLLLVRSSFEALAAQYPEELRLGFEEMVRIRMEDGALVLDPRHQPSTSTLGF